MSDQEQATGSGSNNSGLDAISAIALVVIPVIAIVFWLSGMPT